MTKKEQIEEMANSEGAVLLTKEECDHKVILDEDHFERALNYEREKTRKETAKEFVDKLNTLIDNNENFNRGVFGWGTKEIKILIKELVKQYGVEMEE